MEQCHIRKNEYYNIIFKIMNINKSSLEEKLSRIFRAVGSPVRLQILAAIGSGEACVCHLEAVLGLRQAYISQQLMELRDADLLETRREGRYIYYRLSEPRLVSKLFEIGTLFGISDTGPTSLFDPNPVPHCPCPKCVKENQPSLVTKLEIKS